jgi:chromosome partitioning protein
MSDSVYDPYGNRYNMVIPRNTDLRDAHFDKKDIFSFNPHAAAAQAYAKLINELFQL